MRFRGRVFRFFTVERDISAAPAVPWAEPGADVLGDLERAAETPTHFSWPGGHPIAVRLPNMPGFVPPPRDGSRDAHLEMAMTSVPARAPARWQDEFVAPGVTRCPPDPDNRWPL